MRADDEAWSTRPPVMMACDTTAPTPRTCRPEALGSQQSTPVGMSGDTAYAVGRWEHSTVSPATRLRIRRQSAWNLRFGRLADFTSSWSRLATVRTRMIYLAPRSASAPNLPVVSRNGLRRNRCSCYWRWRVGADNGYLSR